jgi:TPR repeat protein
VAQDLARAEALLGKACDGGAPYACTNAGDLAKTLAAKQGAARYKQMLARYEQGCAANDPSACRSIGIAYLEGSGLPKSPGAAAVWLARACDKDDVIACRVSGAMTLKGAGVKQDVARARELLKRACDRKDDEACRLLQSIGAPAPASGETAGGAPEAGASSLDPPNDALPSRE